MNSAQANITICIFFIGISMAQHHWPEVTSNASRLAISILVTQNRDNDTEFSLLRASVILYSRHLMPHTPTNLYIFTIVEHTEHLHYCISTLLTVNPNIHVITIPSQQWTVPDHVANKTLWRMRTRFPWGYRMMGDWRLTHQMR